MVGYEYHVCYGPFSFEFIVCPIFKERMNELSADSLYRFDSDLYC